MRRFLVATLIGLGLLAGAGACRAATEAARDASAKCVECHDEEDLPDSSRSAHAPRRAPPMRAAAEAPAHRPMGDRHDPRTPTCITCHGDSADHMKKVESGKSRPAPERVFGKRTMMSAEARSDVCQACHKGEPSRHLWDGSAHQRADVACNGCHKVHANRDRMLAPATQAEQCFGCHKAQRGQLARVSHHPVAEGSMTCADCHAVHGSAGPALAKRDSTNATCVGCHAEKRGPFVQPHQPANDDCLSCHQAHGSATAGLLKLRAPLLCQQCHTAHVAGGVGALGGQAGVFTTAPGQTAPLIGATTGGKNVVTLWQGRSCLNCHTQVHGSNHPVPSLLMR
ncbi:decaheme c-type cytochrome, DmsE family [Burkholderiales bacterium JOSHI_001]|nr:decaheme c-type cytochrome, DmsE family [Burkholderiales bacterium JOSHI_001]